jgi:hypothetical protein
MSEIRIEMRPVTEKREKKVKKGSIYDPMIDQFLEAGYDLVEPEAWLDGSHVVSRARARPHACPLAWNWYGL